MSSESQRFNMFQDTQEEETRSTFIRPAKGRSKTSSAIIPFPGVSLDPSFLEGEFEEVNVNDPEVISPGDERRIPPRATYARFDTDTLPTDGESPPISRPSWPHFKRKPLLLVCLIATLLLVGVSTIFTFSSLTPTATITIVPVQRDLQSTTRIIAVTGTPNRTEIQALSMSATETSSSLTVNATGIQYTPAVVARGMITLSNNAPYPQTIVPGPGTIMTGTDGVRVQLDGVVTVPKGSPPNTNGVISVPAHAVQPGVSGNIAAGDINTPCCASNIVALNEATFSGGVDAQPYHVVAQADVDGSVSTLRSSLTQQVQSAISAKLPAGSQIGLITSCTQQPHTQPAVGDKAETVSVSLAMSCTGIAYNQNAASQQAQATALHEAAQQFSSYTLLPNSLHVSFEPAVPVENNPNAISISVHTRGTWVYPLSTTSIQQEIAGKQVQDARRLLAREPGVQHFDLVVNVPLPTPWWNASVLPIASDRIRVIVRSDH